MKCLFGYMIISSAALLGLLGNVLLIVAVQKYSIIIDVITFYFLLYNFAIVGTTSIFFPRGIPFQITQCYLVITSVILAWQLSQFNAWTAWCLLVALALYDLCAVLTPCGPLKALINLMSRDGAPDLPGLIYEARLPEGVKKPKRDSKDKDKDDNNNNNNNNNNNTEGEAARTRTTKRKKSSRNGDSTLLHAAEGGDRGHEHQSSSLPPPSFNGRGGGGGGGEGERGGYYDNGVENDNQYIMRQREQEESAIYSRTNANANANAPIAVITAQLPLAIALIYKLPIESPPEFAISREELLTMTNTNSSNRRRSQYTSKQLVQNVVVQFPRNGGYIEAVYPDGSTRNNATEESNNNNNTTGRSFFRRKKSVKPSKYIVYDKRNNVKRVLILGDDGRVFEEKEDDEGGHGGALSANTIKLGLVRIICFFFL